MDLTQELKVTAREAGADLVGVADLAPFKVTQSGLQQNTLDRFTRAVSIAIRLDDAILDGMDRAPTPDYARHYRAVNGKLDEVTARLSPWINQRGFPAFAVPASQIVEETNLLGYISHKAVARMAGIGWQGKSLLIVSPQYGPRIRLATVLTDMPLSPDAPLENQCGTCSECAEACPASAIKNVATRDRYASREDALYLERCVEQTLQFKARPDIGVQVCGICVKVCPFGKSKRTRPPLRRLI
jgi:epoxyqueuosine reductase QueG